MRRLTAIGLPMLISGVLSSLFRSLDKLMILFFMTDGAYELGCYSAALLVATQLYGIANQLAMVGAPRYAEAWGNTNNRTSVAELVVRNSLLMAWALAGAGLLAVAVATPLLTWFLPAYATGLPALAWLAPGVAAAGLALPLTNYLATVDRQGRSLTVLAGATLCSALALRIVLSNGGGLPAVALTMSGASVVYLIALARTSIWVELEEGDRWRYALHLAGALAVVSLPALVRWAAGDAFAADSGERFLTILGVLGGWGFTALCGWLWAARAHRTDGKRAEADA
jgi:O-antigen/teichoic acid export membrane protein